MSCENHGLHIELRFDEVDVGLVADYRLVACGCFDRRRSALQAAADEHLASTARAIAAALGHTATRPLVDVTDLVDGTEAGAAAAVERVREAVEDARRADDLDLARMTRTSKLSRHGGRA